MLPRGFHSLGICLLSLLLWVNIVAPVAADEWADLSKRSTALRDAGKYKEAEAIDLQLLEAARQDGNEIRIAAGLGSLGLLAQNQGRYPEAEKLLNQSLELWKQQKGCEDAVAEVLNSLGTVYDDQGRFAEAEATFLQVLKMQEKLFGQEHQWIALTISNLGSSNWSQGKYSQALEYFERSRQMRVKLLGPDHVDVATSLYNIAYVHYVLGKYAEAESFHRKALAIREKALRPDHPDVAWSLNSLADMCVQQGRYDEGEQMHQRALQIREKVLGPDHPDVAWSLANLGNLYEDQGKFAQAEEFHRRALRIREKAYGPVHPEVALSLNQLGNLYCRQGSYSEAERLRKRTLEIYEKVNGPDHPDVAMALSNLAGLYVDTKQFARAEPLEQRGLKIRETMFGHENENVAWSLMGLAMLNGQQEKFPEAEALAKQALEIREKVLVADHATIARALNYLGYLQLKQSRFADAKLNIERAIAILEKTKVNPSLLLCCYDNRASLYWKLKQPNQALENLNRTLLILESLRANVAGAEKERAEFMADNSSYFECLLRWQLELGRVDEAYLAAERSHSRTLIEQMNVQGTDLLLGLPAAEAKQLKDRETAAQSRVASLEQQLEALPKRQDFSEAQKKTEESRLNEQLAAARQEQIEAYRAIRNASPAYRLMVGKDFKPVGLAPLQEWVKQQDALLLQYYLGDEAGYLFVISPEGAPQVVKLEISKEQASELGAEAGALTAKQMKAAVTLDGQDLPQRMAAAEKDDKITQRLAALWKLLIPEAQRDALINRKYKRLILVPDGALVNLPFETLVIETGDHPVYLLDRGPPIVAGPSATLLYNLAKREASSKSINNKPPVLSLGNPSYSAQPKTGDSTARSAGPTSRSAGDLLAGFRPGARYATRGSLKALPYSGTEVSWVAEAFNKYGLIANKLLRADATEANLRSSVPSREIVHLACHGLVDAEHGNFFGALALTPGRQASSNPADDGFLTLPEIYELNLKGCELAILSACQTNYGPEQRGEGAWALSRGFLVAGSRRVVASNWLVDDEAAASLVYYFCSFVAKQEKPAADANPVDYAQALHEAKLWIRKQPKWQHPYYWATFTLIGPS